MKVADCGYDYIGFYGKISFFKAEFGEKNAQNSNDKNRWLAFCLHQIRLASFWLKILFAHRQNLCFALFLMYSVANFLSACSKLNKFLKKYKNNV